MVGHPPQAFVGRWVLKGIKKKKRRKKKKKDKNFNGNIQKEK